MSMRLEAAQATSQRLTAAADILLPICYLAEIVWRGMLDKCLILLVGATGLEPVTR